MRARWLPLLILFLLRPAASQAPGPRAHIPVPTGWFSPAPDRWSAPDGGLSLSWDFAPLQDAPEAAARMAMKRFPGQRGDPWEVQSLDGETAWHWTGEFQGRRHRVVFSCHHGQSLMMVFSFLPQQGFAMAACLDEVLRGFRWQGDQGK